jgi:hypothetical protein
MTCRSDQFALRGARQNAQRAAKQKDPDCKNISFVFQRFFANVNLGAARPERRSRSAPVTCRGTVCPGFAELCRGSLETE